MRESNATKNILDEYGYIGEPRRIRDGIIFQGKRNNVAVLSAIPMHTIKGGEYVPIDPSWRQGRSGDFETEFLDPVISTDGTITFKSQPGFKMRPHSVGIYKEGKYKIIAKIPFGSFYSNKYISTFGIYSLEIGVIETNKLKANLYIEELPSTLSDGSFVIAYEVRDKDFWRNKIITPGSSYKNVRFDSASAWDAEMDTISVDSIATEHEGSVFVFNGVPVSWLEEASYPVVIDPTVTYQPSDTTGYDAWGQDDASTTNRDNEYLWGGSQNSSNRASWIKFTDISGITDYYDMNSATLSLYLNYAQSIESTIRTWVSPLRRNWSETGVCWAYYTGTSGWGSVPGINTTTDRYSDEASWYTGTGTPSNGFKTFSVGSQVAWIYYRALTGESTCGIRFASSADLTASERPKLEIDYDKLPIVGSTIFFS